MAMVPIAGSFDVTDEVITFTPTSNLPLGKEIVVTITTDVRSTDNERLADDFTFSFTVVAA